MSQPEPTFGVRDSLVLDIQGGGTTPGTPVIIWSQNEPASPNQQWTLSSDGYVQSYSDPNLVLDIMGGSLTPGTPVIVWPKNTPASNNQRWTLTPDGYLQSYGDPDLVLDVTGGKMVAGTPVQVWSRNSPASSNQLWTVNPSNGHIVSQAAPGAITFHNKGGYVARCTVEFTYGGQRQSQSSGSLLNPQTYSVPVPIGASDIHVTCEAQTGLIWEPWRRFVDQTYGYPLLLSYTLEGTTLSPTFSVKRESGLSNQKSFTFINDLDRPVYAAVHHLGCGMLPWRDGKPKCWDQTIAPGQAATYPPSDWVSHFTLWATLIADGLLCIAAIAATVATAGAAAPAVAAAAELTADTAAGIGAEAAAEIAAETVGEIAVESEAAVASIEAATTETAFSRVASALGMDAAEFGEKIKPFIQLAQRYGGTVAKVGTVAKDAVLAGVAVNSYKALESEGWALYLEVDGHGYYATNYIVSGGNIFIPVSMAISGMEVSVQNSGGYVARAHVEYTADGQTQTRDSGNLNLGQNFVVLVPPGATNVKVVCEEATGLVWEPWRKFVDRTYPGPTKLGTHKAFTLTGTTLDPKYGEEGVTQQSTTPQGGSITVRNSGGYVARSTIEYDAGGQRQTQSTGRLLAGQSFAVTIPGGASNIHVSAQDQTGLVWDPWKSIVDKRYQTPVTRTLTLRGTTLSPSYDES